MPKVESTQKAKFKALAKANLKMKGGKKYKELDDLLRFGFTYAREERFKEAIKV